MEGEPEQATATNRHQLAAGSRHLEIALSTGHCQLVTVNCQLVTVNWPLVTVGEGAT